MFIKLNPLSTKVLNHLLNVIFLARIVFEHEVILYESCVTVALKDTHDLVLI